MSYRNITKFNQPETSHQAFTPQFIEEKFSPQADSPETDDDSFLRYKDHADDIREAIAHAIHAQHPLRARGTLWAHDEVADVRGLTIAPSVNKTVCLQLTDYADSVAQDKDCYFLVDAGMTIIDLCNRLNNDARCRHCPPDLNKKVYKYAGYSLPTFGSHSAQTLAGVISTGVHGAHPTLGAFADMVKGIHIICGPAAADSIYLERAREPITSDDFARKLGAPGRRLGDRDFNAALVTMGNMGVVAGYVLKTERRYAVRFHRFIVRPDAEGKVLDDAMRAGSPDAILQKMKADGFPNNPGMARYATMDRLRHFEVHFNPWAGMPMLISPGITSVVRLMFTVDYDQYQGSPGYDHHPGEKFPDTEKDWTAFQWLVRLGLDQVGPPFLQAVEDALNFQTKKMFSEVPSLASDGVNYREAPIYSVLDLIGHDGIGFRQEPPGPHLNAGFCFKAADTVRVREIARTTFRRITELHGRAIPVFLGFRYLKKTQATLGWQRFDGMNAVLDFDALNTRQTERFMDALLEALHAAHIPFTIHWGKSLRHLREKTPQRLDPLVYLRTQFAPIGNLGGWEEWKQARASLISDSTHRKLFANDLAAELKLF